jgi:hypothetical protein
MGASKFGKAARTMPIPPVCKTEIDAAVAVGADDFDVAKCTAATPPVEIGWHAVLSVMLKNSRPVDVIEMPLRTDQYESDSLLADALPGLYF